jgi:hypothetical protein
VIYADLWRDVREFDDERLAEQIRDDGIDVLVDLTMHTGGARFARNIESAYRHMWETWCADTASTD